MSQVEVGQWCNRPKTGNQGQGIKPWTRKRLCCKGRGLNCGTTKKILLQGQGFKPWTYQKDIQLCAGSHIQLCIQSCIWLHIQSCIWSWELACIRRAQIHEQNVQMTSTWIVTAGGWTTARPSDNSETNQKNRQWADYLKGDESIQKDMFPAEHIFFSTTSCTNLCRLLQVESAYCKTPVEHILQ